MKIKLLWAVTAAAVLSLALSTVAVVLCTRAYINAAGGTGDLTAGRPTGASASAVANDSQTSADTAVDNDTSASTAAAADVFAFHGNDDAILLIYNDEGGKLTAVDRAGDVVYSAPFDLGILTADEAELLRAGVSLRDSSALAAAIEDLTS